MLKNDQKYFKNLAMWTQFWPKIAANRYFRKETILRWRDWQEGKFKRKWTRIPGLYTVKGPNNSTEKSIQLLKIIVDENPIMNNITKKKTSTWSNIIFSKYWKCNAYWAWTQI